MSQSMLVYDIESLSNLFTCAIYDSRDDSIIVFVLDDDHIAFDKAVYDQNHKAYVENVQPAFKSAILNAIHEANPLFKGSVAIYDLSIEHRARYMARLLAMPANITMSYPVRDTDEDYNPDETPLVCGYNSFNYDMSMLALWATEAFDHSGAPVKTKPEPKPGSNMPKKHLRFTGTTAKEMREHNDAMFAPMFRSNMLSYLTRKYDGKGQIDVDHNGDPRRDWNTPANRVRNDMMRTGRHIDIARLNEKQVHVGLKRLCAQIGCQVLESDKLRPGVAIVATAEEAASLIAYNISDVLGTYRLSQESLYRNVLATRTNMLSTYPELVYEFIREEQDDSGRWSGAIQRDEAGNFKHDRNNTRGNRLYPDSSSQQLASRTLCPDGHLDDIDTVSFLYPSEDRAAATGINRIDVLDYITDFYDTQVMPRCLTPEDADFAREQFDRFYAVYDSARGTNYNDGSDYAEKHPGQEIHADSTKNLKTTCLAYVGPDGKPTSCYVSFSKGGIHGAEYDKARFDADVAEYRRVSAIIDAAKAEFGDDDEGAIACRNSVARLKDPVPIDFPDGQEHFVKELLRSGATKKRASWRELKEPKLFVTSPQGNMALAKKYVFTSAGLANHEDFTSYYPGLLRQMSAFDNKDLGYDRYGEIFEGKQRFGKIMKDKSLPEDVRNDAAMQRENVKLILNSASGGGDATAFDTPIRMNNNIISMRLIGQMFTWLIGQAQALAGAKPISTNTDGLYTIGLDAETNDRVLEETAAPIGVEIEPERVYLVSKDSNNRLEFGIDDATHEVTIYSASGDLACWQGPSPAKSLDHPAIVDAVLTRYLAHTVADYVAEDPARSNDASGALYAAFDRNRAYEMLEETVGFNLRDTSLDDIAKALASDEKRIKELMLLFQTITAASPRAFAYPCLIGQDGTPHHLQHYNRVFFVNESVKGALPIRLAAGAKLPAATLAKRNADANRRTYDHNRPALHILKQEGHTPYELQSDNREASMRKLPGIALDTLCLLENRAVRDFDAATAANILVNLDLDAYIDLVGEAYESNWRNTAAAVTASDDASDDE